MGGRGDGVLSGNIRKKFRGRLGRNRQINEKEETERQDKEGTEGKERKIGTAEERKQQEVRKRKKQEGEDQEET
jgi:hypothetical protein